MKHIVGFSGGIDSQATLRWVRNHFGDESVIALNSNAGRNENPLTDAFVLEYSRDVFPVITVEGRVSDLWKTEDAAEARGHNGSDLLDWDKLVEIKGPPLRTRRTCTEFLKLAPQRRWMRENLPDGDYCRYSGVRRDESPARTHTPFQSWDGYFDCELFCPIADWTKQMCFDYVRQYSEPINHLYSLGFDRVGCFCILSGKDQIKAYADRFPGEIEKIRERERKTGFAYFQKGGMLIDEVVEWARTDRGGRQFNIFNNLERPACESKFGLCE